MKKNKILIISIVTIFLCLFLVPMSVYARMYNLYETDMSIDMNDSEWYVFTRENISSITEVEELNLTEDWLYDFMHKNNIYLYCLLLDNENLNSSLELVVRKTLVSDVDNISDFPDKEVEEFAEALATQQNVDTYDIYKNNYKFASLEYKDAGYNLIEHVTIINGECYAITVQKIDDFTYSDRNSIKNIIDSISFEIDETLEEEVTNDNDETSKEEVTNDKNENSDGSSSVVKDALSGALKGAIIAGIVALVIFVIKMVNKNRQ